VRGSACPRPRQSGKVTGAWWSSVGVLGQNHSTDLGRSGTRAEAPADRPAGRGRGPGHPRESHGPGERPFDPRMVLDYLECQREVGPLGMTSPWTHHILLIFS
jgi:hypothetical protein